MSKKKKKFQMPSSMIVLFIVLVFVALLTWIVPTSVVTVDELGVREVHYNASFNEAGEVVENAGTNPAGIWDIFIAPLKGFSNGSGVSLSIIISGAFLAIVNYVGALDAGIGKLLERFSGKTLIAILMLVFALMGTVYGSWEELPAYALILIPLCIAAGYDVVTGIGVLFVGATIGNMASVVNPFSTGSAVAAIGNPELSLGTGIAMRMLLFLVMYIVGTFLVIRYAEGVKKDKTKSIVHGIEDINTLSNKENINAFPKLTKQRKWTLVVFGLMVFIVVLGYIPWYAIPFGDQTMYEVVNYPAIWLMENIPALGNILGADVITPLGDWYFDEFSFVFLTGCIIVALINKLSQKEFVSNFLQGCQDMMSLVVVVSIARGISIIMGSSTSGMSVTFVYWIRGLLEGVPVGAFIIVAVLAYVLIGLFIQGTSSVAGITMPILGAVAMALFAETTIGAEGGQMILISTFTVGLNFMCGVFPEATKMGVLELCNVPYDRFLKFMLKVTIPLLIVATIVIMISPYLGLV